MFKISSWNVNGFRAVLAKGFTDWFEKDGADVVCLQETKAHKHQVDLSWLPPAVHDFWNPAEKKGYSGVVTLCRQQPVDARYGLGDPEHDREGRVLTVEFDSLFVVNVYTPNSQNGLRRLDYRVGWDRAFRDYVARLASQKPVVFAGDLNVAHTELDIRNAKANWNKNPGYTQQECDGFSELLEAGFVDSFRHLHPGEPDHYSWWSYRANARAKNVGWRIDYIGISANLTQKLASATIQSDVPGSDHCPVSATLDL